MMNGWGNAYGDGSWGGSSAGWESKPVHQPDPCKIFIGGIPPDVESEEITTIFAQYGTIVKCEMKKGFAFVTFDSEAPAEVAVAHSEHKIHDKVVHVKSCGPKKAAAPTGEETVVFAGGLPQDVTEEDLRTYFSQFGALEKVDLKMHPIKNTPKGYAFVHFTSPEPAQAVFNFGDHYMAEKKIDVKTASHGIGKYSDYNRSKGSKGKGKGKGDMMANMMNMMWGNPMMASGMMGAMGGMMGNGMGGMGNGMGGMGGMGGMTGMMGLGMSGGKKGKGKSRYTPY